MSVIKIYVAEYVLPNAYQSTHMRCKLLFSFMGLNYIQFGEKSFKKKNGISDRLWWYGQGCCGVIITYSCGFMPIGLNSYDAISHNT